MTSLAQTGSDQHKYTDSVLVLTWTSELHNAYLLSLWLTDINYLMTKSITAEVATPQHFSSFSSCSENCTLMLITFILKYFTHLSQKYSGLLDGRTTMEIFNQ